MWQFPTKLITLYLAWCRIHCAADTAAADFWVSHSPQGTGLPRDHNGGYAERLRAPASPDGVKPHIIMILWDDYGWAEAGWHRNYSIGGIYVPDSREVMTPSLDTLVADGIELDRAYAHKCCSPTRSAVQSGRHPFHVNILNAAMEISNESDPVVRWSRPFVAHTN